MQYSFFKLPVLYMLICWLMTLALSIIMVIIRAPDHLDWVNYLLHLLLNSLFFGLPKYLLILLVSVLALYRCYVNQITCKNISYLLIIAVVMNAVMMLFHIHIVSWIWHYFLQHFHYDSGSFFAFYNLVINLFNYLIAGLISYYGIMSLQHRFDCDRSVVRFNRDNSAKRHLRLFILLLVFIYSVFLVPLLAYLNFSYTYAYQYHSIVGYLVITAITLGSIYLAVRPCFNTPFATLQTARLMKSSVLSFVLSGLVNTIIAIAMVVLISILAYGSYYGDELTLWLVIGGGWVLQLLCSCLIIRAIANAYFGDRAGNES